MTNQIYVWRYLTIEMDHSTKPKTAVRPRSERGRTSLSTTRPTAIIQLDGRTVSKRHPNPKDEQRRRNERSSRYTVQGEATLPHRQSTIGQTVTIDSNAESDTNLRKNQGLDGGVRHIRPSASLVPDSASAGSSASQACRSTS